MKRVTYSEEFFRKTAVFFAERAFTITIEKTHGLHIREFFC